MFFDLIWIQFVTLDSKYNSKGINKVILLRFKVLNCKCNCFVKMEANNHMSRVRMPMKKIYTNLMMMMMMKMTSSEPMYSCIYRNLFRLDLGLVNWGNAKGLWIEMTLKLKFLENHGLSSFSTLFYVVFKKELK